VFDIYISACKFTFVKVLLDCVLSFVSCVSRNLISSVCALVDRGSYSLLVIMCDLLNHSNWELGMEGGDIFFISNVYCHFILSCM
jgi:hypothetical protein